MLRQIPFDQVPDAWRRSPLVTNRKRVEALIDLALDPLGMVAGRGRRPIGKIADVEPPAPPLEGIIERKAFAPGFPNLDAEANHFVVHEDRRLTGTGRGRFHEAIGQFYPLQFVLHGLPSVRERPSSQGGLRADSKMLSRAFCRRGLIPA